MYRNLQLFINLLCKNKNSLKLRGGSMGGAQGPNSFHPRNDETYDCSNIDFRTLVSSPDATVLKKIRQNDILDYEVNNGILVVKYKAEVLGNLIISRIPELVNCILNGTKVVITVLKIENGACTVQVENL
jgi:hypothetical protein